jgi:Zinc knuckle
MCTDEECEVSDDAADVLSAEPRQYVASHTYWQTPPPPMMKPPNQPQHWAPVDSEPVAGRYVNRPIVCHHCQQPGHIRPNCPLLNPGATQVAEEGTTERLSTVRTRSGAFDYRDFRKCNYCRQFGHMKRECPRLDRWTGRSIGTPLMVRSTARGQSCAPNSGMSDRLFGGYRSSYRHDNRCFKCRAFGHLKRDCPQLRTRADTESFRIATVKVANSVRQFNAAVVMNRKSTSGAAAVEAERNLRMSKSRIPSIWPNNDGSAEKKMPAVRLVIDDRSEEVAHIEVRCVAKTPSGERSVPVVGEAERDNEEGSELGKDETTKFSQVHLRRYAPMPHRYSHLISAGRGWGESC